MGAKVRISPGTLGGRSGYRTVRGDGTPNRAPLSRAGSEAGAVVLDHTRRREAAGHNYIKSVVSDFRRQIDGRPAHRRKAKGDQEHKQDFTDHYDEGMSMRLLQSKARAN